MVSNCGKNEYGGISGGSAGDQTGAEFWKISWYNFGQSVVYRHKNRMVGNLLSELAEEAADNNNIGYDQPTRLSFYQQLQNFGWRPANISTPCAADCSSATAALVLAAGHILYSNTDEEIKKIGAKIIDAMNPADTTYDIGEDLANAGFYALRDSKYLRSDAYLLPGDINLNGTAHVNINLTTGANARTDEQSIVIINPKTDSTESDPVIPADSTVRYTYHHLQYGSGLNDPLAIVEALQILLSLQGFNCFVDGEFGKDTEAQVVRFQQSRDLEVNGIVDEDDWQELVLFPG